MKCDTKKPNKESYGFFEEFDYYEGIVKNAENINSVVTHFNLENPEEYMCDEIEKSCYYFLIHDIASTNESPDIICEQFKKIYNLLTKRTRKEIDSVKGKNNDYAFMNYWLNDKLSGNNNDFPICVKKFYQELVKMDGDYFKIKTLEEKLYNMEKRDLENMKNLYQLYNIKNKISTAISDETLTGKNASCLTYTKECYTKYIDAVFNCRDDCIVFFDALTSFKNKYEKDLSGSAEHSVSCKSKVFFELPNYNTVLKENENKRYMRSTILSVLFPILGVFLMFKFSDKFTPFSQYISDKINTEKNMSFSEGERDEELLPYFSDSNNRVYDEEEYNIGYYSAHIND